ncbi:acetylornithine transaminase [Corynebacterium caspium]|uniref:acetylornithine transaminase n=1 Tax=Corynebacterium caspium TaxID=234828 RepID=UPI000360D9A1|nr:acetylornithine transaminase [Corynebacterium caspium]WKD59363.1 Acetylornithine aminotransferase [Corynebacterium caspium DSM 44850]
MLNPDIEQPLQPHQEWAQVMMNNYGTPALSLARGVGATVYDSNSKDYIDFLAGIAVNSLGHAHPALIAAVTEQLSTLGHISNLAASAPVIELAKKLIGRFSTDTSASNTKVFFCNSGAEANEAAFKLARKTGKLRILAANNGFHGRTMGALAMTGQIEKQRPFLPLPGGVEFFPYGDTAYLRTLVELDPTNTAAIILEPIQGETGVIPAPDRFLQEVRELCDKYQILMILDEVQTGVGRTGKFFAFQHIPGLLPDIVTMAKGLGGGLPIGACLATGPAADLFEPGDHGTTFGGNPVVSAAANTVLDYLDDVALAEITRKGHKMAAFVAALPGVETVRGRGLMLAAKLDNNFAKEAVALGYSQGLIINATAADVIRLVPPLVISDAELDTGLTRLAAILNQLTDTETTETASS